MLVGASVCTAALALLLPSRPFAPCPRSAPRCCDTSVWFDCELELPDEDDDDPFSLQKQAMARSELSDTPIENRTVAQLKDELRTLGLRKVGSKPMLIERIQKAHTRLKRGMPITDVEVTPRGELRWYMLQTANGFEGTVQRTLQMAIDANRLSEDIEKIFVPILEGETSVRENSVMPSYIFVRMRMSKNLYQMVSNLQYVVNFVGADNGGRSRNNQMVGNRGFVNPLPVSEEQFQRIVALTKQRRVGDWSAGDGQTVAEVSPQFEVNQMVEVTEGPFKGMQGPVVPPSEAAAGSEMLTVALKVMGRETPVDLPPRHLVGLTAGDTGGAPEA